MASIFEMVWRLLPLAFVLVVLGWGAWRWLQKSDEPGRLVGRWILTLGIGSALLAFGVRATDEFSQIAAVLLAAVCGIFFAIIWGPSFVGWVGGLFTSLYDGGSDAATPQPFYSIAESRRKRGKFSEAMEEVHRQLERFPEDFAGWMLLAKIQAEDCGDLAAAELTVERILAQEGHSPRNIAFALNQLADWHLKLANHVPGAQTALLRVRELLPDTEQARIAAQRLAHLEGGEVPNRREEPARLAVPHHEERLGLADSPSGRDEASERAETAARVQQWTEHLDQHPEDGEVRERLAVAYAESYGRLDLAVDQLEQMIQLPNQPQRHVVRWLNLMVDLQARFAADMEQARGTLQRICDQFPGTAAADNALKRMVHLNLQARGKQKSQALQLGSYDQNIGLKDRS
jgi:tetratricopeptide (TPR) repeat protein